MSPRTEYQAVDSFVDPIPKYYGGVYPERYTDIVKVPMDLGTVVSNLVESQFKVVKDFKRDVLLIFSNCELWLQSGIPDANPVFYMLIYSCYLVHSVLFRGSRRVLNYLERNFFSIWTRCFQI
jgi:hypothetical protein